MAHRWQHEKIYLWINNRISRFVIFNSVLRTSKFQMTFQSPNEVLHSPGFHSVATRHRSKKNGRYFGEASILRKIERPDWHINDEVTWEPRKNTENRGVDAKNRFDFEDVNQKGKSNLGETCGTKNYFINLKTVPLERLRFLF